MDLPAALRDERYCVVTTQGRITGRRHSAELWFVAEAGGCWLMSGSGGLTQWCLNLQAEEQAVLKIGARSWLARASFLREDDEDRQTVLKAFAEKYGVDDDERLAFWGRHAVVIQMVLTRRL